ncbi:hypothetical protein FJV41_34660, partial [Myxococcus llanfairpwllgwyngyllgogerychwyrndrobwllllantysiliogogogochensis]
MRDPVLLSGGNTETAMDVLAVGDRLLLAGQSRLSELETPFMLVTGYEPGRGALVPPSLARLVVQVSRPLAAASVTSDTVRLKGPDGDVPLTLTVRADPAKLDYAIVATLEEPLQARALYTLEVDGTVTDQRGGALLVPLRTTFHTADSGARAPVIASVSPSTVSTAGGQQVTVLGQELEGVSAATVGGVPASVSRSESGELRLTLPPLPAGPADIRLVDQGGPATFFPAGVLALDSLVGRTVTLGPSHGPVEGKTRVRVSVSGQAIAPGTRVYVGSEPGVDVDVLDLSSLEFSTPRAPGAGLVPVSLVRPGEEGVVVGTFSYDLPIGVTMSLPGFPPKEVSDLKLVGDRLYVGVPTPGASGMEIFDVRLEERPLRLGTLSTLDPVYGLDVDGPLALLANGRSGLAAVDVSHPETPFIVRRVATLGETVATGVRLEGTHAYVTTTDTKLAMGHVQVFDAASPELRLEGTVVLDQDALALDLGPERLYVLTSSVQGAQTDGLSLSIYTRTGLLRGRILVDAASGFFDARVRSRVVVRAKRAYVTAGDKLHVFDLSDEVNPVRMQATDLGVELSGIGWV